MSPVELLMTQLPSLEQLGVPVHYSGPERRQRHESPYWPLLRAVLDEIDVGLLLVGSGLSVVYVNRSGRQQLAEQHGLSVVDGRLHTPDLGILNELERALVAARQRGERHMLPLRWKGDAPVNLGIVPLPPLDPKGRSTPLCLLTLQRTGLGAGFSMDAFTAAHGLSPREQEVLDALCEGLKPAQIATRLGIGAATVRSHIYNLKLKTGCDSMVELVQRVAKLPPVAHHGG